jgi:hypothetical protein
MQEHRNADYYKATLMAGDSIKRGVKRSETQGTVAENYSKPAERPMA